jgi:hypothetical protein
MAEKSDYLNAFDAAVEYFASGHWIATLPDLKRITIDGKSHSIRQVCALVDGFGDRLPDEVYRVLRNQMYIGSEELQRKLEKGGSYAAAARCLLELIEQRIRAIRGSPKG